MSRNVQVGAVGFPFPHEATCSWRRHPKINDTQHGTGRGGAGTVTVGDRGEADRRQGRSPPTYGHTRAA